MFILCCFCSQTCTNAGRLCGVKTLRGLKGAYTQLHGSSVDVYLVESEMPALCVIPNVFCFRSQGESDVHTQLCSQEIGAAFLFFLIHHIF